MSKKQLLKPLAYRYRDEYYVNVIYENDSVKLFVSNQDGKMLNLKTLELDFNFTNDHISYSLDDLLDQIDVYRNKIGFKI